MQIDYKNQPLAKIKAECEIVFVIKGGEKHKFVVDSPALKKLGFFEENGSDTVYINDRLYIKIDSLEREDLRLGSCKAARWLKNTQIKSAKIGSYISTCDRGDTKAIFEGVWLGIYEYKTLKSKKTKVVFSSLIISSEAYDRVIEMKDKEINEALSKVAIVCESVNFARELINTPPDTATPVAIADMAFARSKELGIECSVYDEKYLAKQGMGAFLAVARASEHPPRLVYMQYKPKSPKAIIALVGKGLTYDSGGLSLKPADYMTTMKADKSGAITTLSVIEAIAKLKLPIEVHGVLGLCENMIGGDAYKPDDVLTAKNGKTIEIKNTDAEGRLVLADCLCFIQDELKAKKITPDYILDIATLTGACIVALGEYTTGIMGYNKNIKDEIFKAAEKTGELLGDLPFNKHLSKLIKSEAADISNCSSSRYGGAITAALFLSEFIAEENKEKWIHLDIAGPAYVEKAWSYNPHGASGAMVRTLIQFAMNLTQTDGEACSIAKKGAKA